MSDQRVGSSTKIARGNRPDRSAPQLRSYRDGCERFDRFESDDIRLTTHRVKIAAIAANSNVGVVVMMRRRGEGLFGPRQGSISYQVLCEAHTPMLALPSDKVWIRCAVCLRPKQ